MLTVCRKAPVINAVKIDSMTTLESQTFQASIKPND
jgi:hypothetical protein